MSTIVDSNIEVITQPITESKLRENLTHLLDSKTLSEISTLTVRSLLERLCDIQSRINFLESACNHNLFPETDRNKFSNELSQRYVEQNNYIESTLKILSTILTEHA